VTYPSGEELKGNIDASAIERSATLKGLIVEHPERGTPLSMTTAVDHRERSGT